VRCDDEAMLEDYAPEWKPGMRFEGDLMGFWAYNDAREPRYTLPEERVELEKIAGAVEALRRQGWRDAVYCPKDGTRFLVIEAGCTAVYPCIYRGEWPTGHWFVQHAGDEWPARPILFRPMREPVEEPPAQIAQETRQSAEEGACGVRVALSPTLTPKGAGEASR
jgi:hypothetical protein